MAIVMAACFVVALRLMEPAIPEQVRNAGMEQASRGEGPEPAPVPAA